MRKQDYCLLMWRIVLFLWTLGIIVYFFFHVYIIRYSICMQQCRVTSAIFFCFYSLFFIYSSLFILLVAFCIIKNEYTTHKRTFGIVISSFAKLNVLQYCTVKAPFATPQMLFCNYVNKKFVCMFLVKDYRVTSLFVTFKSFLIPSARCHSSHVSACKPSWGSALKELMGVFLQDCSTRKRQHSA